MTTSVTVRTGLFEVTQEKISFLCHVYYQQVELFICLSRHAILILDQEVKEIKAHIQYQSL